jgi:hypothetical protein
MPRIPMVTAKATFPLSSISLYADAIPHSTQNGYCDIVPTPLGDLNFNGKTDMYDAIVFSAAFGTEPGQPLWNSCADLNNDKIIDIFDAVIMGIHFGEERPDP